MNTDFVPPDGFDPTGPALGGVGLFTGFFGLALVGFGVLFMAVLVFIIVVVVRNARVARQAGYDPLTMQTQMATRVMGSELLRPAAPYPGPAAAEPAGGAARTVEERLAELDDLHARGVISADERSAARSEILRG